LPPNIGREPCQKRQSVQRKKKLSTFHKCVIIVARVVFTAYMRTLHEKVATPLLIPVSTPMPTAFKA
jgi:hypothetical protein